MKKTLLICAGEASGENYGAQLISALQAAGSNLDLDCFGIGGERMRTAGFDSVVDSSEIAVVGLVEVLKHLPGIYSNYRKLITEIDRRKPDAAVLIDSPAFNIRLARQLHRRGIPVIYFVAPQFWAWRTGRVRFIRKYFDKVLVIFPFEEKFFRDNGVEAEYVGHPLAEAPPLQVDRLQYSQENSLDIAKTWIGLLPGSRKQEIERNLPEMIRTAQLLGPSFEFLLPVASTIDWVWLQSRVRTELGGKLESVIVRLVKNARTALFAARASVVASGTATVEAALAGNPFVVVYRVSPITFALGRRLVHLTNFAMSNLIAGKTVVPELIQSDFTAVKIIEQLRRVIPDGSERFRTMADLATIRDQLKPPSGQRTPSERAAQVVIDVLNVREQQFHSIRVKG